MKKLFLFLFIISFFNPELKAKDNDREFGVIQFYTYGKYTSSSIIINNIDVLDLPKHTILNHKFYSEGKVLMKFKNGFSVKYINAEIKRRDTLYIAIKLKTNGDMLIDIKNKENALNQMNEENKEYNVLYSTERITYPYIPESFEKSKKEGKRSGSGFLLSQDGYIATNYHVIENTKKVVARGVNGNKNSSLSLKVVYTDTINDLAILKLEDKITIEKPIYSFKSTVTDVGENIFVLGYPLTDAMGVDIKLTDGLVSSKNGFKGDTNSYQISAPVQPGNSGAPLFDKNGNIVGIINAKLSGAENATYAIKVGFLQEAIKQAGVVINTNQSGLLSGKTLPQQVKAIQDFVYIIEAE